MSREIKFRAWDKTSRRWYLPPSSVDSSHGGWAMTSTGLTYVNGMYQDLELMQFIGLRDVNGVDIYEGDVIRNLRWGFNCQVVWKAHGFYYKRSHWTEKSKRVAHITEDEVEVIGNMKETPELLKEVVA